MNQFQYQESAFDSAYSLAGHMNAVMRRVYLKMTLGLIVSALVAMLAASSTPLLGYFTSHPLIMLLLFGAEIGLVIGISGAINKLSSSVATMLFFLFAIVNGLSLFPILLVYTHVSIFKTFFITAGVFGAMSVYGMFTTRDLTNWGTVLIMGLFGLIIVSLVNIFLKSPAMEWIISGAGVLIFIGLTAWDTQRIKQMALMVPADQAGKVATIGALNLYLDFINLFLYLLRFFGNRN
ncbi:MAG: Bax inhibitor-1/YccA family protein [Firmicutes bacterium]|nr:Bax inhibitor-1/YccA family protein [Bacillota bacterium]MCM1400383.1 Bax inhibitor-1/YccA family protein [Bacteroides sp.]MCM1477140.1 Bax inhibitor-1/YccA family protein [Bacteroides sp.]